MGHISAIKAIRHKYEVQWIGLLVFEVQNLCCRKLTSVVARKSKARTRRKFNKKTFKHFFSPHYKTTNSNHRHCPASTDPNASGDSEACVKKKLPMRKTVITRVVPRNGVHDAVTT
jgi:hypothetical protein